jgi:hypothetical protein
MDDILESGYEGLNMVPIRETSDSVAFTSAVLVIRRGDENIAQVLRQYVQTNIVLNVQAAVRAGTIPADY